MTSPLRVELRARLTAALRARDRQTATAMRSVIAALENAEALPVTQQGTVDETSESIAGAVSGVGATEAPRRLLSSYDERAVVQREIAELRSASAMLVAAGHHERAAELTRMAESVEQILEG